MERREGKNFNNELSRAEKKFLEAKFTFKTARFGEGFLQLLARAPFLRRLVEIEDVC